MSIIRKIQFLAFILCLNLAHAENLIQNADFKEASPIGLPVHWELRPFQKELVSVGKDGIVLSAKNENVILIQSGLQFVPNQQYEVRYRVKSPLGSNYQAYIEWTFKQDGVLRYKHSNASPLKASENWEIKRFPVEIPEGTNHPYMVFSIKKGQVLEISEVEISTFDGILRNGNFAKVTEKGQLEDWQLKENTPNALQVKDNTAELRPGINQSTLLVQRDINMIPGKSYKVTYEVKGSESAQYRVYTEWVENGGLRSANIQFFTTPDNWRQDGFTFDYPASGKGIYIALQAQKGKGTVAFKNISVQETVPEKIHSLGGKWEGLNGAKISSEQNRVTVRVPEGISTKSKAVLKGVPLKGNERYSLQFKTWARGGKDKSKAFYPFRVSGLFGNSVDCSGTWDDTWEAPQNKSFTFSTPKTDKAVKMDFIFESRSSGDVFFSDFKLEKVPAPTIPELSLILDSPFFRNSLYSSSPENTIAGRITVKNTFDQCRVKLFNTKDDTVIADHPVKLKNAEGRFSIPASALAPGEYKLTVEAGQTGQAPIRIERIITKLPPSETAITCRPDLVMSINGKPFFPIIFWTIFKELNEETLYHASRNGVNSFVCVTQTAAEAKRILDLALKFNMKVMLDPGAPKALDPWLHRVSGVLTEDVVKHPALFGFLLADEPAWNGTKLSNLLKGREFLREKVPHLPVWINAAPRGSIETHRDYSKSADIYGVDIYPVPYPSDHSGLADKGLTSVGKYTARMHEACSSRKPIWMVLQAFAWGAWTNMPRNQLIYPDLLQSRFVAYDAVIAGANGISYWGAATVERKDFADIIYQVCRELSQLSGLFVRPELEIPITSDNPHIKLKGWKYNGNDFIIAINHSEKQQRARIGSLTQKQSLSVSRENRSVNIENGFITDSFKPYDVHVYCGGPLPPPATEQAAYNEKLEKEDYFPTTAREMYSGKAKWIWGKDHIKAWSKVDLEKTINISKKIAKATVLITADDYAELYINSVKVFTGNSGWNVADRFDCSGFLKQGENIIHIKGTDYGRLPCGVLFDLSVTFEDGSTEQIISDESWSAVDTHSKAAVIAPYGGGVWGARVEIKDRK